jgi:hypothetical protein
MANLDDENDQLDDEAFDYEDLPELPPNAGKDTAKGFEPADDWLKTADRKLQHAAMRHWFLSRYEDPAMETPWTEGSYLYVHGGPYEAADELYDRFGDVLEDGADEIIGAVVEDVESEGIHEWAPIHHDREDEFDERFALAIESESEPLRSLRRRLQDLQAILTLAGPEDTKTLARRLVFAALIGALETFLYEVAYFWIDTDEAALRAFVSGLPKFKEEKFSLAEIFKQMKGLKSRAKGHLQATVWHRWDHVAQIYKAALDVQLPSTADFVEALDKRHDIVHRSGHNKGGVAVQVADNDIVALAIKVEEFAVELEKRIKERENEETDDI